LRKKDEIKKIKTKEEVETIWRRLGRLRHKEVEMRYRRK
jgi:hypothetical protein